MNRRDALGVLGAGLGMSAAGMAADDPHAGAKVDGRPADRFHLYLCAFHVAKADPKFVVEAHHYCMPVGDEVNQCVIFDRTGPNARILGVEYIISDALYRKLPDEEKKYYHPHSYEVLSGLLVAPDLARNASDELMKGLITTWGKTWHTWPDPKTALPMGEPLLMWAATGDGQVDPALLAARDKQLGISTEAIRRQRASMGMVPQIPPPASIETLGRQFTASGRDVPPATP